MKYIMTISFILYFRIFRLFDWCFNGFLYFVAYLNNINIFKKPIIASGGVTNLKDLQTLKDNEKNGIEGVICGRAIYEGKIDITEANKIFEINWYVKN